MDSQVDHPRPSTEADEPAAKHFKALSAAPLEDGAILPDAPAIPVSPILIALLDSKKESSERDEAATFAGQVAGHDTSAISVHTEREGPQAGTTLNCSKGDLDAKAPLRYKTSLCSYFRKKGCKHGQTCRYAHGDQELQPRPDGTWDPTSERAKRMETEKEILERMTTVNTAKAEAGSGHDECAEFGPDVVNKCINNLPWTWNTGNLKDFLEKHNLEYTHAKKKKGMHVGFVGFENVDQMLSATKAVEGFSVQRKQLEVADVHPRPWEKQTTNHPCSVEGMSIDGNTTVCAQDSLRVRDICDAVTPLSGTPYDEQLVLKRSALAQVLKRLARNIRKSCPAGVLLPDWILAARESEGLPCEFEDIIPSPIIDGYRNKCEFSIGCSADGKRVVGFQLGTFREGITAVVEPSRCQNVSRIAQAFALALQRFVEGSELPVWNKHSNTGFWRMLTVREGRGRKQARAAATDEQEVMLIVQVCPVGVSEEKLGQEYKNMRQHLSNTASRAEPLLPLTVLLVQEHIGISNAAPADCPITCLPITYPITEDAVEEVPAGKFVEHIHDQILDLCFQISPTAFFQVNTLAAEKLYALAGEWACLGPDTLLFDVCCGTGTIGLTLAHRVGLVVGIEMNASAVADAWTNAKINDIKNCEFVCAKAEDVFQSLLDKYTPPSSGEDFVAAADGILDNDAGDPQRHHPNGREAGQFKNVVVIVDPPRSGLHPVVLRTLRLHERLQRIVYLSCNPETLMANAVELCTPSEGNSGKVNKTKRNVRGMTSISHARQRLKSMPESRPFRPVKAAAVDMFPHTNHCEMVMLFER